MQPVILEYMLSEMQYLRYICIPRFLHSICPFILQFFSKMSGQSHSIYKSPDQIYACQSGYSAQAAPSTLQEPARNSESSSGNVTFKTYIQMISTMMKEEYNKNLESTEKKISSKNLKGTKKFK